MVSQFQSYFNLIFTHKEHFLIQPVSRCMRYFNIKIICYYILLTNIIKKYHISGEQRINRHLHFSRDRELILSKFLTCNWEKFVYVLLVYFLAIIFLLAKMTPTFRWQHGVEAIKYHCFKRIHIALKLQTLLSLKTLASEIGQIQTSQLKKNFHLLKIQTATYISIVNYDRVY